MPTLPTGRDPQVVQRSASVARAFELLAEAIGATAAANLKAGGAYPIPSKLWPGVVYLVPKAGTIKIVKEGKQIHTSCLVVDDAKIPWPDVALARIKAIQVDETIVYTTGNLS